MLSERLDILSFFSRINEIAHTVGEEDKKIYCAKKEKKINSFTPIGHKLQIFFTFSFLCVSVKP